MIEDGVKLTTYFGERDRTDDGLLADALLGVYARHRVRTSVLLRGVEGFGVRHHLRTDRMLTLSEDLPVVSVAVDVPERIDAVLEDVLAIKRRGLITLERAGMITADGAAVAAPDGLHEATKLTVYLGRRERVGRTPAFVAVCDLLRRHGIARATVLLGVDGTLHGRRERAGFVGRNADVPMMVVAVGSGERLVAVLSEIDELLHRPLLTFERVRICKRDGVLLERPRADESVDEHGLARWQKLTVYSSDEDRHGGMPLHVALVRALRETGARGATTLRGIWGFHGDRAPYGDRILQLRRRVPALTIVVDSPDRIARSFEAVAEITDSAALVTCETVPALGAIDEGVVRGGLRLAQRLA